MHPKELRKLILELLYKYRQDDFIELKTLIDELRNKNILVSDRDLHGELKYLDKSGFIEIKAEFCGKQYLNFHTIELTSYGIDLVEDPEEFNKLFTINISQTGNVQNSNVSINSQNVTQNFNILEYTPEIQKQIQEFRKAIENKDDKKVFSILKELKHGAKDVFWNILAQLLINIPQINQ